MFQRLENFMQDKLLSVAVFLGVVVALLSTIFGMFLDLLMIGLLTGVVGLAAWVERRQKDRVRKG